MVVVGADPAARFPNARQRVGKVVRNRHLDIKGVRDGFQSIGRRLERQRAGEYCFTFALGYVAEPLMDRHKLSDLNLNILGQSSLQGLAGLVM